MVKNKVKTNVALVAAVASITATGLLGNTSMKVLNESKKQNDNLSKQIIDLNDNLKISKENGDKLIKAVNEMSLELEKSDKKIKELESKINTNASNIKKLQATNLKKQRQANASIDKNISSTNLTPIKMKLTFYGDFASENGGYAATDAQGNKLVAGTIASNAYSFGTKFTFNNQVFTVRDRGGKSLNNPNKLDVFVPRLKGESDLAYKKRILKYGVKTVTAYKIN
jgi:TolA-binding protein